MHPRTLRARLSSRLLAGVLCLLALAAVADEETPVVDVPSDDLEWQLERGAQERLAEIKADPANRLAEFTTDGCSGGLTAGWEALDHGAFFGPASTVVFDAVSLNISGDHFYQTGKVSEAMAEYRAALRLDADDVNVYNSLGVCLAQTGEIEKAAACS